MLTASSREHIASAGRLGSGPSLGPKYAKTKRPAGRFCFGAAAQTSERCRRISSTRAPPTSVVRALPSSRLKPASSKKRSARSLRR